MPLATRIDQKIGVRGIITFRNFGIASARAEQIEQYLATARSVPSNVFRRLVDELASICTTRTRVVHNQVLLAARGELANRLAGAAVYTGIVNYGALGTGATAVADSDIVLDTEVARATVATATATSDSAAIDFYFSKASTNGTYQEFGLFIDGTSSADTGLLFNRALTGGWTKTSLEAMTVSVQVNFDAA